MEKTTKASDEKVSYYCLMILQDFLKDILITDTFDNHDTLTVSKALVENLDYFFDLLKKIVGSNIFIVPHEYLQIF